MKRCIVNAVLMICLLAGCATEARVHVNLAITDVTIIDPETRQASANRTVLIDKGRIVSIMRRGAVRFESAQSIDGRGRYLMPGLMDMHVHTNVAFVTDNSLKLMLANGVTGARDMAGDCWEPRGELYLCLDDMRKIAAEIEQGDRPGPRLLKLSSAFVQSGQSAHLPENHDPLYTPSTKEEGVALVQYLDERGVDLIKLYEWVMPGAYEGLMSEAKARGIEISGHVPLLISTVQASNDGLRTIEHANSLVIDCSPHGDERRNAMKAVISGDESAAWPSDIDRLKNSIERYSSARCKDLMATLVKNGTHYVPTHGTREMDVRASEPGYRNNPDIDYIPPMQMADWKNDLERTAEASPEMIELYRQYYELGLKVTKLAFDLGVPVMIGTDANDTMIVPGFAVHDELQRFVDAGLSPMDALRAATTVPAAYLGRESDFGAVAPGKIADLVLLDQDPLKDIANTRSIEAVIFEGRIIDREELDALLAEVRNP